MPWGDPRNQEHTHRVFLLFPCLCQGSSNADIATWALCRSGIRAENCWHSCVIVSQCDNTVWADDYSTDFISIKLWSDNNMCPSKRATFNKILKHCRCAMVQWIDNRQVETSNNRQGRNLCPYFCFPAPSNKLSTRHYRWEGATERPATLLRQRMPIIDWRLFFNQVTNSQF